MKYLNPPIFCDKCPSLALAQLAEKVLCVLCLKKIISSYDSIELPMITPLNFAPCVEKMYALNVG